MNRSTTTAALDAAYAALGAPAERERVERYRLDKTLQFVERHAGGYVGKRVLELGSSVGIYLVAARRLGASEAVGLDKFLFPEAGASPFALPTETIQQLRAVWDKEGVTIQPGDLAATLPFPDGRFDLVVCNAVIEHLHGSHRRVFTEAHRVLAPGGHFVFTTPNVASLLKRLRFLVGRSPLWDLRDYFESGESFTGHIREFTPGECARMLAWSGFTPAVVRADTGYFKWKWFTQPRKVHYGVLHLAARALPGTGDLVYAAGRA